VSQGYTCCVMSCGPMGGGKSNFFQLAAKGLLAEVFKGVDEATKAGGKAQSFTPSYTATCVEVNCDGIFDLNNSGSTGVDVRPMRDTFGSVVLDGALSVPCQLARDAAVDYMAALGRRQRQRSHIIYTLHVTLRHKISEAILRGKFILADLAGAGSLGDQADVDAGKYVNKSVTALNNVINALATPGNTGIPYRDDPLTMVLSDALGGNCRLSVVCAVGPTDHDAEGAATALNVASRLTSVECNPVRRLETAEYYRLRSVVAQLQSPEAAEPVLSDIDNLRE
jgi:kinesin family protein 5